MYTRLRTWPRLLLAAKRGRSSFRLYLALFAAPPLHLLMLCAVNCARALDHLFSPRFRKVSVKKPTFVVATPRSGTTFLHHLLALDEKHFTHQRLYQTVFPTVFINHLAKFLRGIERTTKIPLSKIVSGMNSRMFQHWDGIHSVGLDAEEEDESLFVYALHSPALYLLMPFIREAPEFQNLDEGSDRLSAKIAEDYVGTAQRHLLSEGKNEQGQERGLLIKNVLLPSRLHMTRRAFPDARYIRLVRDPRTAIPSAMSLFFASWEVLNPQIQRKSDETRALGEMFVSHYRRLHEEAQGENGENVLTVRFEDLIADPVAVVRKIYAFLGHSFEPEYEARLRQVVARPKAFKSEHNYTLDEFGWTENDVTEPLADLLPDLGYQTTKIPSERRQVS